MTFKFSSRQCCSSLADLEEPEHSKHTQVATAHAAIQTQAEITTNTWHIGTEQ